MILRQLIRRGPCLVKISRPRGHEHSITLHSLTSVKTQSVHPLFFVFYLVLSCKVRLPRGCEQSLNIMGSRGRQSHALILHAIQRYAAK